MGYRSDLIIAVGKNMLMRDLIENIIPHSIKEAEFEDIRGIRYYKLEAWKWYDTYPEVTEIDDWLNEATEDVAAIRIGEDYDDVESWGDCVELGLHLERTIRYPL